MQNENAPESKIETTSVLPISIEKELKTAFLDYAMSVIISRALPDIRDGLKPVQRRILYALHTLGYYHTKPFRKSATVVGEVMGKYHPHGDSPIYQAMVSLVQTFSKRYPLLEGQGNWGSVDGDNAAAMRYTETRMAKISQEVLCDIEKNTVPFTTNYDESISEPTILPSKIPTLLINGATGIAVGMATSIPPHNLGEILNASIALLKNPNLSQEELFNLVPAPDFPTGGIICGRSGVVKAYTTGHGNVIVRGVVDIEENKKHLALVITELPYQVNKVELINKIADLVKNKIIEGISNIRDESDKRGIRLVIELKRAESPQIILNQLYKHTDLQTSISILMLALYQNKPTIFTLREMIEHYLLHRKEIITKRSEFDLDKNKAREHVLTGLLIALDNIDDVIVLIKKSQNAEEAIAALHKKYHLTDLQGKAILDMRLQRLTGLEKAKLMNEIEEIKQTISQLQLILNNEEVLKKEINKELEYLRDTYADKRLSKIEAPVDILSEADLIPDEEMVVTLTKKGYIKRVPLSTYDIQHRGGKGKKGMADLSEADDLMQDIFVTKNHDELLFFTNHGRVYSFTVFQVPEGSRTSKGRAVVNLLPLVEGETVVKLLCVRGMENKFLVMVTKFGVIKKTNAMAFAKIRSTGIRAVTLEDKDELEFCAVSGGNDSIIIATKFGQGIHFKESEIRAMGRQAMGVRGIRLKPKDEVVGLEVISDAQSDVLFATSNGYGKRVKAVDFRVAHRGGMGVRTIPTDHRNGHVIGLVQVSDNSTIILIDTNGKIIRIAPDEVRTMGRQAKGVRLIRLDGNQELLAVVAFETDGNELVLEIPTNLETSAPIINSTIENLDEDENEEIIEEEDIEN
ncbi:TPA: DNA gyrase subunit A [Candidatus Dependentiae bacterium]|nr:MAG: gyrase subunit A protein [candidate division TM6 bacterium GW2011_GWE2_31_21]KKP53729.1 MAG: gyrase subunit A protein [candidate division TM6 bacterium GW2011_GWF2_33_332]HBS48517.1 DNA gyrase subunit A [Candidatus Dependentiae bacterium]HBZ73132.1 DNA gyrase subunit A [Candidatus Dependentiae bacterium]